MITKLKRKFTVLATVSVLLLMAVLVAVMNLINLKSVIAESDKAFAVVSNPGAVFADEDRQKPEKPKDMAEFMPRDMSPEVPYETRFFSATVNENGEIIKSDLSRIISVDSDSAESYINKALSSKSERGFIGQFRYYKTASGGTTRIFFLDCGRKLDAFYTFLWTSIAVGLGGCLVVFILFLFFSGRIIKPISEAYEKQKRFISDAGHEIKTPLTVINANVDLLECEGEREELTEIRNQTKRMTELTNDLVALSKMEEFTHTIQKIDLPLSDTVSEAVAEFKAPIAAKDIALNTNIEPGVTLTGSPDDIRKLLLILLENAVKYSKCGGNIAVILKASKKTVKISVLNSTAEKINESDLPRVFDRFYRTDTSRNSATGGHGIGLSIAKAITEAHKGNITAQTKTGYDFCVTVTLPL